MGLPEGGGGGSSCRRHLAMTDFAKVCLKVHETLVAYGFSGVLGANRQVEAVPFLTMPHPAI